MVELSGQSTLIGVISCSSAADTLGTLARTIGGDNFKPLAPECVALGTVSFLSHITHHFLSLTPPFILEEVAHYTLSFVCLLPSLTPLV